MWQRVQTLYLFLATALIAALFFCHKAGDVFYTDYWPYMVLLLVVAVLNVMALTTYKHRIFQMRTATLSAIILLGLQVWLVVDCIKTHNTPVFSLTAVFPVVAMILNLLAARGILADELLVRNSSRLRAAKRGKK
jgi:uncharacterized membrane protein